MVWLSRRFRIPPEAAAGLDLAPGERVLAAAKTDAGDYLVATDHALRLPLANDGHRIGWESIDRATWNQEQERLTIVEATPRGQRPGRFSFHLAEPGRLIEVVHERVNAAVVLTRFVPVHGDHGIRVTGRRRHGFDALVWTVSVDSGVDPADPVTSALITRTLREAKADVGE